jgi:acetyl-CoA carboxylase carboxyl transferase subunit alpha
MDQQKLTAWDKVQLARHPKRPTALALINHMFPDFIELHGDRQFRDDPSIIGGIAELAGQPVTIIAQEKGTNTTDKIKHNFGMPHPEGYRKALRLMKQAEKFGRPIITIIDTPGAYPGIGAEERGQAQAIAYNLFEMSDLKTPIMIVVLSEGGSGGALAIGVGDHIMMFEHSIYAILSPEGYASIIYKDAKMAKDIADVMKITAQDLKSLGIIDDIIIENEGLHVNDTKPFNQLKSKLIHVMKQLLTLPKDELVQKRYDKFRKMGIFGLEEQKGENKKK